MCLTSSVEHSLRPGSHSSETALLAAAKREPFCLSMGHSPSDEFELSSLKQSPLSVSSDLSMSSGGDGVGNTRSDADPLLDSSLSDIEPAFYLLYSLSVPPFESPRLPSSVDDSPRVSNSVGDSYSVSVTNDGSVSLGYDGSTLVNDDRSVSLNNNRSTSVSNDRSTSVNNDRSTPVNNDRSTSLNNNQSTSTNTQPTPLPFPSNRILPPPLSHSETQQTPTIPPLRIPSNRLLQVPSSDDMHELRTESPRTSTRSALLRLSKPRILPSRANRRGVQLSTSPSGPHRRRGRRHFRRKGGR